LVSTEPFKALSIRVSRYANRVVCDSIPSGDLLASDVHLSELNGELILGGPGRDLCGIGSVFGGTRLRPHLDQGLIQDAILVENDDGGHNGRDHQGTIEPKLKFTIPAIRTLFLGALSCFSLRRSLN
jgi:hypothetical protein